MRWILYYICGYTVLRIPLEVRKHALNILGCCDVLLLRETGSGETRDLCIFTSDAKRAISALEKAGISPIACTHCGFPSIFMRYRHRIGLFVGGASFFLLLLLAPRFIWEIRIVGANRLSQAEVADILADCGVSVGAYIPHIDRDGVYAAILQENEDISWLSVNFRGSIATVEIVERDLAATIEKISVGANIVAAKDGRITDMQVSCGNRVAAVGEIVKAGDLLVSGVYDTGRFGTRFVRASAAVLAEVTDTYTVVFPLLQEKTVYQEEKILETDLIFFKNAINIFKKYNKTNLEYDIITRKEPLPLPASDRLPFSLVHTVALPYQTVTHQLSQEAALTLAREETERQIANTAYTDLLSSEETYSVEDNELIYTRRVYAVRDIAKSSPFTSE